MDNIFESILLDEKQIDEITTRLGAQISKDYQGKEIVVIGMLKGAMPFMMDLIKKIDVKMELDFMQISSYHGGTHAGTVVFKKDIETNVYNKHVIIIDDIIDTGVTMNEVMNMFKTRHVASIQACCLLDKPHHRKIDFEPKYVGKVIPDGFVVGYGLDLDEFYRNVPFVGILKKSMYEK